MVAKHQWQFGVLALCAVASWQAQADYQCAVNPQDDVVINSHSVQVVGRNGNLLITPNGDISYNDSQMTLNDQQRQAAVDYQAALRHDLPWIDQGARSRLEKARQTMDGIIVKQLGEESRVRNDLADLNGELQQQMNRIIEHRNDGLIFHYQAVEQVKREGHQLVENRMGTMLQDSLNEMSSRQSGNGGNPLQALVGGLGGLQQSVQNEFKHQEKDFQNFGNSVCQHVTALEAQRKELVASIK
jgi:hypothetical protein